SRATCPTFRPQTRDVLQPSLGLATLSLTGRSGFVTGAETHQHIPPKRVRYPTDHWFASGCFPHRLAATQLPSATEPMANSGRDFHSASSAPSRAHAPPPDDGLSRPASLSGQILNRKSPGR